MNPQLSNENLSFGTLVDILCNYLICKFAETGKDDARKGDQMERLQKGEEVDIDPNDPEVQQAATKIQASFRGHKAREDVKKHKDEEAAAVKIQASFGGHKAREQVKEIKVSQSKEQVSESVDAAEEPQYAEEFADVKPAMSGDAEVAEDKAAEGQPDEPAAAVEAEAVSQESETEKGVPDDSIAAGSTEAADAVDRGETEDVQAEEAPAETKEAPEKDEGKDEPGEKADEAVGGEVGGEEEQIDLDMSDPDLQSAVVKIQASFRGHKAREEVKALKSSESLPQGDAEQVPSEEKPDDEIQEETEDTEKQGETEGEEKQGDIEGEEKQGEIEGDEKLQVSEGDGDKGNDDAEPSVAEDADDSKPSED